MVTHLHLARPVADRTAMEPGERDAGEFREARPIRVVLADDHAFLRRSLRLLLDDEDGLEVIAEAADIEGVMRHVHGHLPDVLVLDLSMPSGSSIGTIRRLRERVPDTQIVVLTMQDDPAFAQQAIDAGAIGFVLKELADLDLPDAVRAAARGRQYLSKPVAARLASADRAATEDHLTPREIEVLHWIALGHTSAEIAAKLHLSVRTIETYRARIHRKLGLSTRAELVRYALRRGLLEL
jgi:two-component system, NarL family, response regulator NreC